MREKVIALTVSLIIFIAVLIIGVSVVARSSEREKSARKPEVKTVQAVPKAEVQEPLPPPPPVKKYRFKRTDRLNNRMPFDYSTARRLPQNFTILQIH